MWASSSPSSRSPSLSASAPSHSQLAATERNSPAWPPPAAASKTMEEVWRDISLASDDLPRCPSAVVILQDFFSRDPPNPSAAVSVDSPPPPPQLPTVLTLSSAAQHFSSLLINNNNNNNNNNNSSSSNQVYNKMPPPEGAALRKRFSEFDPNSGDRRHKRMIKNRESAARSRARKQAYTNELELEVAHLLEENAKLKQQQEQLCRAAAAQHQKKKALHRTSTAPF